MNRVDYLLEHPFSNHSLADKLEIKRLGPHQPIDIVITQYRPTTSRKHENRKFVVSWFSKKNWLTVSESKKGLYCFPCLLFGQFGGDSAWSKTGYYDLKHLSERIKRHESGSTHINNCVQLKLFGHLVEDGDGLVDESLLGQGMLFEAKKEVDAIAEHYRRNAAVQKHNAEVDRNRFALSKLVDCIVFCLSHTKPLHNAMHSDLNQAHLLQSRQPGEMFFGLVRFAASLDNKLADALIGSPFLFVTSPSSSSSDPASCSSHSVSSSASSSSSRTRSLEVVRDELLDCMLQVYRDEVITELSKTRFVSVQIDNVSDVSHVGTTSIVLRYLYVNKLVERLWGFVDVVDVSVVGDVVAAELGKYGLEEKLVAQTNDGAFPMRAGSSLQHRIKEHYPYANFVQCYIHPLTVTIERATCVVRPIRVFFANLSAIVSFFSVPSQKQTELLKEVCKRHGTQWMVVEGQAVCAVVQNREILLECLEQIVNGEDWDFVTVHEASALRDLLYDTRFSFFLRFFNLVMPFADILHQKLQQVDLDEVSAYNAVQNFTTAVQWIGENEMSAAAAVPVGDSKMMKVDVDEFLKGAAKEACDIIIQQVMDRFKDVDSLLAFQLVDSNLFHSYKEDFPEEQLNAAANAYPMISKEKLLTELQVLYKTPYFKFPKGAMAMMDAVRKNDLKEDFSETYTLLEIAVTTPTFTTEADRCFDTLKRTVASLNTFVDLGQSRSYGHLNVVSALTVIIDFLKALPNFNALVIQRFSEQENRRSQFVYDLVPPIPGSGYSRK